MFIGLVAAGLVLVVDQLSKLWVRYELLGERGFLVVNDYFNVVTAWNTGVSFSMFDDLGILGIVGLSVLDLAIVLYFIYWMEHEKEKLFCDALGCIIFGALCNVIDRVRLGAVFDFLDVHVGAHHWPAFNVADSFICIGAAIIVLHGLMVRTKADRQ